METRNCGDCNMCCKLPSIPNIKKDYEWCSNCDIGIGCKIYDKRPKKCKDFYCLWKIGTFPENLKPNKVGFFATMDNELSKIEKVITIYCETYKLDNIKKFLKDINITDESGQTYRFVIRYNNQEDDLYIYDPKVVNQLIYANRKKEKWTF